MRAIKIRRCKNGTESAHNNNGAQGLGSHLQETGRERMSSGQEWTSTTFLRFSRCLSDIFPRCRQTRDPYFFFEHVSHPVFCHAITNCRSVVPWEVGGHEPIEQKN